MPATVSVALPVIVMLFSVDAAVRFVMFGGVLSIVKVTVFSAVASPSFTVTFIVWLPSDKAPIFTALKFTV